MGRDNNKAKERRKKQKEESDKIGARQRLIDDADKLEDPMESLAPFKKYNRNGLSLTLSAHRIEDLDADTVNWAFDLTKTNMQKLYEDSDWGWNDRQKRDEMMEDKARYLIARDDDGNNVAVSHFRYDLDNDIEILYCYEIQLTKPVRRKGLGKFMMQILELLAHKAQMKKVMCTVFNNNKDSKTFFMDKLKYEIDETSPSESMEEALYDEDGYTYEILCKKIGPKKTADQKPAATKIAPNQTNGSLTNGAVTNGHAVKS